MRLSRIVRQVAAILLVIGFTLAQIARGEAGKELAPAEDAPSRAARFVQAALEAEVAGDAELRAEQLQQAIAADANYAPAHWQAGEVRVGNRWLPIDEAMAAAKQAGKVDEYRRRRDQVAGTAAAHIELAHWCAAVGLKEQQRLHLTYAMQLDPTKKQRVDIVKRLDLVRYQKALIPRVQAATLKAENEKYEKAFQEWKPQFTRLRADLESRDLTRQDAARVELLSVVEESTIPALEVVFAKAKPEASLAVVAALSELSCQAATDSLVRHVVFANHAEARQAAAEALKPRSIYSYVPTLMSALESPVEVNFQADYVAGHFRHYLTLYQEGPLVDQSITLAGGSVTQITISRRYGGQLFTELPDQTAAADMARANSELAKNEARIQVNQRIIDALATALGKDLGKDPLPVWEWWLDHNETYRPPQKPVTEQVYNRIRTPIVRYISCFVAGTPVWTSTGPMPIEQVRIGECVLAQDPASGELSFKPVLATTVRPPSPLIEIDVAGETIRATRGHPFWVAGLGWQMAKELQAGQLLHGPHGPLPITRVEQFGEAECYNLVVAEFNTYFVGNAQVLVHDNNLRQVTTATVPGLVGE